MPKLILYAPNVHTGGGKTLLMLMLKDLEAYDASLILDKRLGYIGNNETKVIANTKPTLFSRYKSELILKKNSSSGDVVLCFHSLPPIFKSKAKVLVYFHNKHLINQSNKLLFNENYRAIIRILLERFLASIFYKNVDEYIVQTKTMKRNLDNFYSKNMSPVNIYPFMKKTIYKKGVNLSNIDFVYVSVGLKHKNHKTLIRAWVHLAEQGIYPKLTLTLAQNNIDLINMIDKLVEKHHIKVENLGYIDISSVADLYSQAKALIYPSLLESFGLPLIEAQMAELPILASELDYVRDVCDPIETFDPKSHISIARAVKRYLKITTNENKVYTSHEFIQSIYKDVEK